MKRKLFDELLESIREAGTIHRGEAKPSRRIAITPDDIRTIRKRLGRSQTEFALMIGVSVSTLRNWEQGRRVPEGPARALLRVASVKPEAVIEALWRVGKPEVA